MGFFAKLRMTYQYMPKKTKKQKILAQLHRKLQFQQTYQFQDPGKKPELVKNQNSSISMKAKLPSPVSLNNIRQTFAEPPDKKSGTSYDYVKKDLIKITIFTVFAFVLYGVLYFVLRTS